ncbi:hypothetical protein NC652_034673 [Populus alba x Populus x berolinensis]|nr:hypothetical protein NC652_034673 [Populus alba x Populus x berolinensis]
MSSADVKSLLGVVFLYFVRHKVSFRLCLILQFGCASFVALFIVFWLCIVCGSFHRLCLLSGFGT